MWSCNGSASPAVRTERRALPIVTLWAAAGERYVLVIQREETVSEPSVPPSRNAGVDRRARQARLTGQDVGPDALYSSPGAELGNEFGRMGMDVVVDDAAAVEQPSFAARAITATTISNSSLDWPCRVSCGGHRPA